MGFQPGHSKSGGRKKGTPNKLTTNLLEALNAKKVDPIEKIIEILPLLTPEKQVDTMLTFMQYIYPKRKAIEHFVERETSVERRPLSHLTDEELDAILEQD